MTEGTVDKLKEKISKAILDVITTWADDDISRHTQKIFQELLPDQAGQLPEDVQEQISAVIYKGLLDQIQGLVEDGELAEPAAQLVKQQVGNAFAN